MKPRTEVNWDRSSMAETAIRLFSAEELELMKGEGWQARAEEDSDFRERVQLIGAAYELEKPPGATLSIDLGGVVATLKARMRLMQLLEKR
jgi:hypothetical protein